MLPKKLRFSCVFDRLPLHQRERKNGCWRRCTERKHRVFVLAGSRMGISLGLTLTVSTLCGWRKEPRIVERGGKVMVGHLVLSGNVGGDAVKLVTNYEVVQT